MASKAMLSYQLWFKETASFSPAYVTISQFAPKQLGWASPRLRITWRSESASSTRRRSSNSSSSLLISTMLARTSKLRPLLRRKISGSRKVALETRRRDFHWWCGIRLKRRWCNKDRQCRPSSRCSSTSNRNWMDTWLWERTKRMEPSNKWNFSNL